MLFYSQHCPPVVQLYLEHSAYFLHTHRNSYCRRGGQGRAGQGRGGEGRGRGGEGRGGEGRGGEGRGGRGGEGEGRGGDCPHFPQTRTFVTAEPSRPPAKRVTG